jgi:HD-GYP domain-containing protein (c-di-GMP phosphodiesterase class II)
VRSGRSSAPATSAGTGAATRTAWQGEDIPRIARIVACCDAYNAMTTDRPYRAALPLEEALAELERGSGGQFDPAVVEALAHSLRQKPA